MKKLISDIKSKLIKIKKEKIVIPCVEGNYLDNRFAFITGGSSGIGYAIAHSYLKNGASVIITGRNKKKLADAKETLIESTNVNQNKIRIAELDITNVSCLDDKINNIISESGWIIDVFVNNAGVNGGNLFPNTTEEEYDIVMDTNLKGMYFVSQIVCKYMILNNVKGNILNITSSSSLRPAISPYIVSKWGERSLTLGLAKKYLKYGIVVNGLAPGSTLTPMLKKDQKDNDLNLNHSPSQRYLAPEEVGNMATILVSSIGKMIIGDTIFMTGGLGIITFDDIDY